MIEGLHAVTGEPIEVEFDGFLTRIETRKTPSPDGFYIAPGFIDLQVNGFGGTDYNSPATTLEAIEDSLKRQFSTGVTRLLPTVITGEQRQMADCLRKLALARTRLPFGSAIEGFHVEGPHISPEEGPRGAHPRSAVRAPDLGEFAELQTAAGGHIRIVTLSPEWPDSERFTRSLVSQGVIVSIGHTRASTAQINECVAAGATMSTHLGNGAHAVLPKFPNYIWDQLSDDRLMASFIVDGIHLDAAFLKAGLRAKGLERSVLVTDAVMPAGCAPGLYRLGELDVELHVDGRVTLRGTERLAGSSLRMDRAVANVTRATDIGLGQAVAMAAQNPARCCRIAHRRMGLATGEIADLVRFQFDPASGSLRVLETYISGQLAYSA